ncbi:MAG: hypothetical protein IPK14_24370 [Blastocatellia bacterium]|nr:hypothetical protein [Blastocatellia bacterium]MBL8196301.1 hypothetical protein [Blastocatellia bacterium]MBN8721792.1 hypothetical protein [Acidobacteriota bacterium]
MNKDIKKMLNALGDYSLEYRMCHLLSFFAASDGDLSQTEIEHIAGYLKGMIEGLGSDTDLESLVVGCINDMQKDVNVELLKESIAIFAEYLPSKKLKEIADGVELVIGSDELSEAEAELLECLKKDWGLV